MAQEEINIKIGGQAGWGIKATGEMLARTAIRAGLETFAYVEYPSLIQGGHNAFQVRVSPEQVYSQKYPIDLLIALNQETVELHQEELVHQSGIIFDGIKFSLEENKLPQGVKRIEVPLEKLATEDGGPAIMRNTVALGAVIALLDADLSVLEGVIKDEFADKSEKIVLMNQKAARAGYRLVKEKYGRLFKFKFAGHQSQKRMLLTGNTAVALGALAAGCQFYVAYPMTPASSILHYLASVGPDNGMVVRHAEDEIGVINEAIGAAFAGARVMCATSGGGFALMNEAFSLAGMTETPLVVGMVQRPGPATGMPTWTEQGDLLWTLNAGHGEFPRIVLAPGDPQEAFELTVKAFNLAEKYQTPVILLSDKHLAESAQSSEFFRLDSVSIDRGKLALDKDSACQADYGRYQITGDGISPRAFPGQSRRVVRANSDEHDEKGFSSENPDVRVKMVNKRLAKLNGIRAEIPVPEVFGSEGAEITFISWGSVKGSVREAVKLLADKKIKASHLHLPYLQPFPAAAVKDILASANRPVLVENNATGQLGRYLREQTGIELKERLLKYDGRPFYPGEIVKPVLK